MSLCLVSDAAVPPLTGAPCTLWFSSVKQDWLHRLAPGAIARAARYYMYIVEGCSKLVLVVRLEAKPLGSAGMPPWSLLHALIFCACSSSVFCDFCLTQLWLSRAKNKDLYATWWFELGAVLGRVGPHLLNGENKSDGFRFFIGVFVIIVIFTNINWAWV